MTRVLVVEDDAQFVRSLSILLSVRGYEIITATTGADGLRVAVARQPQLILLDMNLPDMPGLEVLAGLRGWVAAPVVVLSGRTDSVGKVAALDAGATDYVVKPFGVDELLARVRAVLRRSGSGESVVATASFTVDLAAKKVTKNGLSVHLTPTEWGLLETLVRNRGELVERERLLTQVWGPQYVSATNYVRVYLAQLRRKLEDDPSHPRHLLTVARVGYRFEA